MTRLARRRAARIAPVLLALVLARPGAAAAEPLQAVVELFTSQGCGACRPADALVADLAAQPGVLALTLPVTYWDYLGWKDTLAQRPFTERQHAYAAGRGVRQLFTPQVMVNGTGSAVGSDRDALTRLLQEGGGPAALPVRLRAEERGDRIVVEVEAGGPGKAEVWLVPVMRRRPVTIERGENRGRSAVYVNVARGLQRLGAWTGQAARFEVTRAAARIGEADAWAVLLQGSANGRPGRIWGAAKGPGL